MCDNGPLRVNNRWILLLPLGGAHKLLVKTEHTLLFSVDNRRRRSRKGSATGSVADHLRGSCLLNGLGTSLPTSRDNLIADTLQNGKHPPASTFIKHTDV